MAVQVPDQQQSSRRRGRWNRLVLISIAIVFLAGVGTIWMVSIGSVLSGILSIVFTLLSILIAFLQWQPQPRFEAQVQAKEVSVGGQGQRQFYEEIEGVVLEVNKRKSALIVYARKDLRGSTINLSFGFHNSLDSLKVDLALGMIGRKRKGSTIYTAVFSSLEPGNYTVYTDSQEFMTKVSIFPGRVEEIDWR